MKTPIISISISLSLLAGFGCDLVEEPITVERDAESIVAERVTPDAVETLELRETDPDTTLSFEVDGMPRLQVRQGSMFLDGEELASLDIETAGDKLARFEESIDGEAFDALSLTLEAELGDEYIDALVSSPDPQSQSQSDDCFLWDIYDGLDMNAECQEACMSCAGCESAFQSFHCLVKVSICENNCYDYGNQPY